MAHCKTCGRETFGGNRMCYHCLDGWTKGKIQLFDEAVAIHGKLSPTSLPLIQKYVKKGINKATRNHGKRWWEVVLKPEIQALREALEETK